jgi:coenzyme F420-0:L-glutamate ligase/coenzyme F420-1:gamma-L-glutamate ligase
VIGTADEIAAAASLVMGGADEAIPAVIVRGVSLLPGDGSAADLQRPRETDLFR